jgi:flagellar assembly factor FliW
MNIKTKYHGEILLEEKDVWHFHKGIPGFENEKEFVILPLPGNEVFSIMQSVVTQELAFVMVDPFIFFQNYNFNLDESTMQQLVIEEEKDVIVSIIMTVKNPFEKSTANLQAPLIFNNKNKIAKQLILNNPDYKTRHPIYPDLNEEV